MKAIIIGVSADLIDLDSTPKVAGLDLAKRLSDLEVDVRPIAVPANRVAAPSAVEGCDIVVLGDCRLSTETIDAAVQLRHIAKLGKGYDDVDVEAASRNGIIVTAVVDAGNNAMATGVMSLMLALSTRLFERSAMARQGPAGWGFPMDDGAVGLSGRRLGIVGFGHIGRQVARLAGPFGLNLQAFDPQWSDSLAAELRVTRSTLPDLMSTSDFISINCPLNAQTQNMISADLIARMKSTAFLINTGRGAVVDEIALADALDAGCIDGAALDVFSVEPLPQDHRLMRTRNLILTPHSIGTSDEMYTEYMDSVEQAIRQVLSGQTPETAVNVPRSRG